MHIFIPLPNNTSDLYLYQNNKKSLEVNKKSLLALPHVCSCITNPLLKVLKPGGLIWASPSISHLSGSHLVFPRLYTCVAYMGSILVYLPLLFSLLSFSSFIKNPFSRKPHELKNRLYNTQRTLKCTFRSIHLTFQIFSPLDRIQP